MKTPEQFGCFAVIQPNAQLGGCYRTTSPTDRSSHWTGQHHNTTAFLLCTVTVYKPVYRFLCTILECTKDWTYSDPCYRSLEILRIDECYFSSIYQLWCPEHCRKIETPLWAWLDHITDSLNIWEPLAKIWPIQVTSYCNLFHLLEG